MNATPPMMEQAEVLSGYLGVGRHACYSYLKQGCPLDPDAAQHWVEQREANRRARTTKAGRETTSRDLVRVAVAAFSELDLIMSKWVRHR